MQETRASNAGGHVCSGEQIRQALELSQVADGGQPVLLKAVYYAELRTFVEEMCVVDPKSAILTAEIYAAYEAWAEGNDQKPLEKPQFGTELLEVCRDLKRTQNVGEFKVAPFRWAKEHELPKRPYYYTGITLAKGV